ncbi:tripartite tricarboxylate transporter substrate binding protein [Variovorax sp. KK3]|nr:tripartite tricarboxylate transporter substrate binding protein [Variovorax sp. KK3]
MLWVWLAAPSPALADFPDKPIRMIVPFAAGGPTDVVARMLAEKMGAALKQSVVVDNRGGAGGAIGTDAVAKARPDGYTLGLATASTHEFTPACNKDTPYDPVNDFQMIGMISSTPTVLFVKRESPLPGLKEVLELSRQNREPVTWGVPGNCSNMHFLLELINKSANAKIAPIPYRGNSAANTDLLAGQITMVGDAVSPATLGLIKSGSVRPIALSAKTDVEPLQNVPTYAELGINVGTFSAWQGLVAPAKTPPEIVEKLNGALRTALADPELKSKWVSAGIAPSQANAPDIMRSRIKAGFENSRKLAEELHLSAK